MDEYLEILMSLLNRGGAQPDIYLSNNTLRNNNAVLVTVDNRIVENQSDQRFFRGQMFLQGNVDHLVHASEPVIRDIELDFIINENKAMSVYRTNNPLEYALVDGIVIDEKASPPSIKSSGTGVAMLLGRFERGPDEVVSIPTTDVLYQTFGSKDFGGLRQLYNKKFSQLKIKRVRAFDALPSESVLKDPNYVEPQPDPTPIDVNVPVKQLTNDDPTVTFEVEGLIAGEEYTFKTGVQYTVTNGEVVTAKVDSESEYTFQNADGTEETICTFTASGEKCAITYSGTSTKLQCRQ